MEDKPYPVLPLDSRLDWQPRQTHISRALRLLCACGGFVQRLWNTALAGLPAIPTSLECTCMKYSKHCKVTFLCATDCMRICQNGPLDNYLYDLKIFFFMCSSAYAL